MGCWGQEPACEPRHSTWDVVVLTTKAFCPQQRLLEHLLCARSHRLMVAMMQTGLGSVVTARRRGTCSQGFPPGRGHRM